MCNYIIKCCKWAQKSAAKYGSKGQRQEKL